MLENLQERETRFLVAVADGTPNRSVVNNILSDEESKMTHYFKILVIISGLFHVLKEFSSIVLNIAFSFSHNLDMMG